MKNSLTLPRGAGNILSLTHWGFLLTLPNPVVSHRRHRHTRAAVSLMESATRPHLVIVRAATMSLPKKSLAMKKPPFRNAVRMPNPRAARVYSVATTTTMTTRVKKKNTVNLCFRTPKIRKGRISRPLANLPKEHHTLWIRPIVTATRIVKPRKEVLLTILRVLCAVTLHGFLSVVIPAPTTQ